MLGAPRKRRFEFNCDFRRPSIYYPLGGLLTRRAMEKVPWRIACWLFSPYWARIVEFSSWSTGYLLVQCFAVNADWTGVMTANIMYRRNFARNLLWIRPWYAAGESLLSQSSRFRSIRDTKCDQKGPFLSVISVVEILALPPNWPLFAVLPVWWRSAVSGLATVVVFMAGVILLFQGSTLDSNATDDTIIQGMQCTIWCSIRFLPGHVNSSRKGVIVANCLFREVIHYGYARTSW